MSQVDGAAPVSEISAHPLSPLKKISTSPHDRVVLAWFSSSEVFPYEHFGLVTEKNVFNYAGLFVSFLNTSPSILVPSLVFESHQLQFLV